MAVGHWTNLTEAEKLTNSVLIGGLIEENIKRGGILPIIPLAQFQGLKAIWNRENAIPSSQTLSIGGQLNWQDAATVTQLEAALKIIYVQTPLNHYVSEVYGSINNYRAIQLLQNKKAMLQGIEDLIVYGDLTYSPGNLEFDGLHALAQASGSNFDGDSLDVDQAEAGLSLGNLRAIEDRMKHGVDVWVFPTRIATRLDQYVQENGLSTNTFGQINFTMDELGRRVSMWNGRPILRSDYLVAEQANTGVGSNARAKHSSGDQQFSVFALKFGNVLENNPGITLAWGDGGSGSMGAGELWKTVLFENLEDFDSAGLRLVTYMALLDGSSMSIGRIYDIEDVAVVA